MLVRAWLTTTVVFLSGVYVPVAGALFMLFTPQPGLALERREGKASLVTLVLLTAATAAVAGGSRLISIEKEVAHGSHPATRRR